MFSLSTLLAVALALHRVNADFIVLTDAPPQPSLPADWTFGQSALWKQSVIDYASTLAVEFGEKHASDTSFLSLASIAEKKQSQFFATATYSFQSQVTATDDSVLITTVPVWYAALPTEVKQYNEIEASALSSIQSQAYKNVKTEDFTLGSSTATETSLSATRSSARRTSAPSTLATATPIGNATRNGTSSSTSLSNPVLTSTTLSASDATATSATISSASPTPTGAAGKHELEGTLLFGLFGAAFLNLL
ncbi:hypothetical protein BDV96DRAFT_564053 [Lophiotrema nucula]|uniref:Ser-Thr-rich glycosyl-phosphatidyl-inositol-anchored membrane family-domain-containing protein n=1 Tax=Lophiotrema nucula TaxID=690887 RepID=A0A6A5ZQU2_9PLEO|nr:hypothetical protein BDV96DRAFT_564053 [Lophiotrema nucula]